MRPEIAIIGAGIVDIPLSPVDSSVFDAGSTPLERIAMHVGGDAANEAMALARLGRRPMLVSKLGRDAAGDFVLGELASAGVDTSAVVREEGLDTGINVVLVTPDGERRFLTNRNGSLRRLGLADILPALEGEAFRDVRLACLASLFVSPELTIRDAAALLSRLKARGITLCADTTRPKRGETATDLAPVLELLDFFLPNLEEAAALTGETDPDAIADALLARGLGCAAVKLGGRGCLVKGRGLRALVPAVPGVRRVDTTGAGDAFAAGFMAGILEGREILACARWANAVASVCVERVGATLPEIEREDLEERVRRIGELRS